MVSLILDSVFTACEYSTSRIFAASLPYSIDKIK
jgi:hypothetical protein